jgi:hypothetical protein
VLSMIVSPGNLNSSIFFLDLELNI